jgi:hypothetical protein
MHLNGIQMCEEEARDLHVCRTRSACLGLVREALLVMEDTRLVLNSFVTSFTGFNSVLVPFSIVLVHTTTTIHDVGSTSLDKDKGT